MDQTLETLRSTLGDRYRVDKAVGRGGMATVYVAHDIRHDRRVAIKVLSPDLTATVGADRFTREVKIAAQLSHPNILGVFDSGETERLLYYVMPYVEGESLRDKLNREGQLSIDEAIQITCEVAEALGYAHAHDIVHRDIKPENILLQSGRALVADFGIARLAEAGAEKLTATGMAVGTAAYMSPEQASGMPTDARADIYALGCTLFEMLAGQPPFVGANAMQIMSQHHMATVPEIRVMRHSVPEELDLVIRRAMEKTPADRFQTMEDFKRAVLGEIPATTTSLPRYTARYRTQTAGRKEARWREWAIAAVVIIGVLGAGAMVAQRFMRADAAPDANKVAVLYFDDETGGSMQHVADGLTESLIDRLDEVRPALSVVPANGVRAFRGRAVSSDSVRAAFGIGTIVKGGVSLDGSKAKVTINMIDAIADVSLKRESITVDTAELATLQGAVADKVADVLREAIGDQVRLVADRGQTRSTPAWTMAERAAKFRKDADSLIGARAMDPALAALARADSLLTSAQRADARWAKLPAMRASIAATRALMVLGNPVALRPVIDSGVAAADAALALESSNADALEAKGRLLYLKYARGLDPDPAANERLLAAAESTLNKAVQFDRNHAGAWAALSTLYYLKPDISKARAAAERAYESDAYLASANGIMQRLFWTSHDLEYYPEALDWCTKGYSRFPTDAFFTDCRLWMYTTTLARPNIDSVWAYQKRFVSLHDANARAYADRYSRVIVAGAYVRANQPDSAKLILDAAHPTAAQDPQREIIGNEAVIRVMLGQHEQAVTLLENYLAKHPDHLQGLAKRVGPWWRDIQGNARFKRLISTAR
ncbi:MAG TPA: serine/threonine-protein kinase [Gemmatimonadaceae bacterium]|nr:serine/threonine-protein kinase [Gemmatimonadaceae bacterium]